MKKKGYEVLVIGSGLGGLMCAAILAKQGVRVCVLEKHHKTGGNLQTFTRKGVAFNSAMHIVGSLDKGQILNKVFSYLGILDQLGLEKLNPDAYEQVHLGGRTYSHANGTEAYRQRLLSYFPDEGPAIDRYLEVLRDVWNSTNVLNLQDFRNFYKAETQYTNMNAFDFIESLTQNEELKALWGMNSALYAGVQEKSPLITHAIISSHYIQSAYKFSQGSDRLSDALESVIRSHGGEIMTSCEAEAFKYEGKRAKAVVLKDGRSIEAGHFISNIHPASLVQQVEAGRFRRAYVSRISELENTIGAFCLYLSLKPGRFRNIKSNVSVAATKQVWVAGSYDDLEWPASSIIYTTPDPENPDYARTLVATAFMKFEEVEPWSDSAVERRGKEYQAFKDERAGRLLDLVHRTFPGIRDAVEHSYTATPLTFRDYTGIPKGAIYGILKDCNNPRRSYISSNTRVENLFLTGQNAGVGLHGVLGVTISSFFTLANFLDIGHLLEEIRNE